MISKQGIGALKVLEGFRPMIYKDQAGHQTIGFGHKITTADILAHTFPDDRVLDDVEATDLLYADLAPVENVLNTLPRLSANQYDALCCFVFNIGVYAFEHSTIHLLLTESAEPSRIADQFLRWVFVTSINGRHVESPGLRNRREQERAMFLYGVYPQDEWKALAVSQ